MQKQEIIFLADVRLVDGSNNFAAEKGQKMTLATASAERWIRRGLAEDAAQYAARTAGPAEEAPVEENTERRGRKRGAQAEAPATASDEIIRGA